MSNFTEADLPLDLHHGEILTLSDGSTVRFESNAEAKDIFFGEEWSPSLQLFPNTEATHECGGCQLKLTAMFDDTLKVEKI